MSSCLQSQGICPHVQVISLFSITNPLSSSPGSGSVFPGSIFSLSSNKICPLSLPLPTARVALPSLSGSHRGPSSSSSAKTYQGLLTSPGASIWMHEKFHEQSGVSPIPPHLLVPGKSILIINNNFVASQKVNLLLYAFWPALDW